MKLSGFFQEGWGVLLLACGVAFGLDEAGAATQSTGYPTHLALEGTGWFVVRDAASGQVFATRRGDFRADQNGFHASNSWTTLPWTSVRR